MYTISQIKEIVKGEIINFTKNDSISHISFDSRSIKNGNKTIFFALKGEQRDGHTYVKELFKKGVKNFVVSNSIALPGANIILVKNTLMALQDLAIYHRSKFHIPVIGITGSHGKTIVKEWLYQLLQDSYNICRSPKSFNSQIGVPISVLQLSLNHNLAIFEAGISRSGEMGKLQHIIQPTIGVFTGLGEAHDSGFKSREEKKHEKFKLFEKVNVVLDHKKVNGIYEIPFSDKASIQNCLVCIAVLEYLGLTNSIIQEKIKLLNPLALRLEMKEGKNGNTILNDSYNISLKSLEIALDYLSQQSKGYRKMIIISDVPEYNYTTGELESLVHEADVDKIISIGEKELKLNDQQYTHFVSKEELKSHLKEQSYKDFYILIKGARRFQLEEVARLLEHKKHQTVLSINLNQVEKNLAYFKNKLNPGTKLMVMVKAFAYGSGTTEIPKLLQYQKVDYLGVAYCDEGVKLREAGITTPIMVMNPEPESFDQLIDYNLEPEIYSLSILDEFIRTLILYKKQEYPIHLKIETGMNRLGVNLEDISSLLSLIKSQPEVYIKSVFSHLSSADLKAEKEFTLSQIKTFSQAKDLIIQQLTYKPIFHILNTAGVENYPEYQMDMVRLGIGLHGINTGFESNQNIKPVVSLTSQIIQIKDVKEGDSIGYGRNFKASNNMKIGIIPIGYADGLKRSLGNGNYQFFTQGEKVSTVGNICMDTCMVDLTKTKVKVGDVVEVFGPNQSIQELAKKMETIPYEVMTSISQRVKRVFIRE